MKKVFAVAVLFTVLSVSVCVGKDGPVNPYHNNGLDKYYNPRQADFRNEYLYLRLQSEDLSKLKNGLSQSLNYDYGSIWPTGNEPKNGVIGSNYQRIEVHIGKVAKSNYNADIYLVTGKSKVNNNICDFSGEIKLTKLFYNDCSDDSDSDYPRRAESSECAKLFAEYVFYEDSTQKSTGVFKGIMECDVYTDKTNMRLDESKRHRDGYWNRTFIGIWSDYKTKAPKKCIWGDHRLPFTFDFDTGDGEMTVNDKYLKYGWQSYQDGSESVWNGDRKRFERKNKWWLKK